MVKPKVAIAQMLLMGIVNEQLIWLVVRRNVRNSRKWMTNTRPTSPTSTGTDGHDDKAPVGKNHESMARFRMYTT